MSSKTKAIVDSFFNARIVSGSKNCRYTTPKKNFIKLNKDLSKAKDKGKRITPRKPVKSNNKAPESPNKGISTFVKPRVEQRSPLKSSRMGKGTGKKRIYKDDNVFDYYSKMESKIGSEPTTCIEKLMDHMSDFFQESDIHTKEVMYNAEIMDSSPSCVIEIKVEEVMDPDNNQEETIIENENQNYERPTSSKSSYSYNTSYESEEFEECEEITETDTDDGFTCLEFPWDKRIYKSPKTGRLIGYTKKEPILHQVTRVHYPYYSYLHHVCTRWERRMEVWMSEPRLFKTPPPSRGLKPKSRSRLVMSNLGVNHLDYDVIVCVTPQKGEQKDETYTLDVNINPANLAEKICQQVERLSLVSAVDREFLTQFAKENPESTVKNSGYTISLENEKNTLQNIGKYFICLHKSSEGPFQCAMNKVEQSSTLHTCNEEQNNLLKTFVEYTLNPRHESNQHLCHNYIALKVKEYFQENLYQLKKRSDQNFTLRFDKNILVKSPWTIFFLGTMTVVFVLRIMEIYLSVFHS